MAIGPTGPDLEEPTPPRRRGPLRTVVVHIERTLGAGILVLLPIGVTVLVFKFFFDLLDPLLQEPALHRMIKTLADRYEMPMPKVAIIDTAIPNAFATGRNPKNALVAVTTGIQQRLSERELQAVIGHELAHVANRDMRVLAIANFLVTLTSFLMTMLFWNMLFGGMGGRRSNGGGGIMMVYLVTIVVYFIGQLLVLALTRYREYGADHTGAEISGDPGALADALEKISGTVAKIPDKDLRKLQTANAFLIIPAALKGQGSMNLFSTHPPLQERIKRLRELEQRMRYGLR